MLAAVSCTKVHNVTGNKYKFVQIAQETATDDRVFSQLHHCQQHDYIEDHKARATQGRYIHWVITYRGVVHIDVVRVVQRGVA